MDWRRISAHAIRSGEFVIEKAQMFGETLYFPQHLGRLLSVTESAEEARSLCEGESKREAVVDSTKGEAA